MTLVGIVTLVNPLQSANAEAPMDVTLLGIVMLVNSVQPENAPARTEMTLLGRVTLFNPVEPENAKLPMEVTGRLLIVAGITKLPLALGLLPVMVILPAFVENKKAGTTLGMLTVNVRVLVPVPAVLMAEMVTDLVPAAVGVPEMSPLVVFTLRPVGRPVAAKLVGVLLAVIV